MSSQPINNSVSDTCSLTTAISGQTPTDPFGEEPTLQALIKAKNNAEFNLLIATIPREHKIIIRNQVFVRTEAYKVRKSRKTAWYWVDHGEELIGAFRGLQICSFYSGKHG